MARPPIRKDQAAIQVRYNRVRSHCIAESVLFQPAEADWTGQDQPRCVTCAKKSATSPGQLPAPCVPISLAIA